MTTSFADATITVPYAEIQRMQTRARQLEEQIVKLKDDVLAARLGGPEHGARSLYAALAPMLTIVGYAIAHMPPLAFRGWPYAALREMVTGLKGAPGVPEHVAVTLNDYLLFANDCERWEKARAQGIEQELFAEENARHALGPAPAAPPEEIVLPPSDDDAADGGGERDRPDHE